jgi:hypothetical protein
MRNRLFKLVIALLTFGISVTIVSLWANFNSIDKRFAKALQLAYPVITEEICNKQSLTPERCEKLRLRVANENVERTKIDVTNTELGCRADNLSVAECSQRKEEAIKDIEENFSNRK